MIEPERIWLLRIQGDINNWAWGTTGCSFDVPYIHAHSHDALKATIGETTAKNASLATENAALQARVTELEGVSNQNTQPKGYFCQFSVSYNKDAEKMYASNPAEYWPVHDSSHEMSFVDGHGTHTKIASFKHAHEASAVEARLNELINATDLWKSKCINSPQEETPCD